MIPHRLQQRARVCCFKQECDALLHGRDSNGKGSAWVQAIESAMEVLELISPYY